jgi:hypothetical protein
MVTRQRSTFKLIPTPGTEAFSSKESTPRTTSLRILLATGIALGGVVAAGLVRRRHHEECE